MEICVTIDDAVKYQGLTGAVFSPDGLYRYQLWRMWSPNKPRVLFVGLNPSTANSNHDYPTIRRCMGFAASWGYGGMFMGNLFGLVSPLPKALLSARPLEHEGGHATAHLLRMAAESDRVIAAWGSWPTLNIVQARVNALRPKLPKLWCLGKNHDSSPKHPLYLPRTTTIVPFI